MLKRFYNKTLSEAGVDEAGRGCLAGPVTAAAVILRTDKNLKWYKQLNDSKKLNPDTRKDLRKYIENDSVAWAVGFANHLEIDEVNILNATYIAMHRAVEGLRVKPEALLVDGNRFKVFDGINHTCIIKGDELYLSIAAASILAKTHRDDFMENLHHEFPGYGWDHNKAYATEFHRDAIERLGLTPYHRKSFRCIDFELDDESINISL
jgi:ribonuclease HII